MKSDKYQSIFMIGVCLLIIGGILLYVGFTQPKVYVEDNTTQQSTEVSNQTESDTITQANSSSNQSSANTTILQNQTTTASSSTTNATTTQVIVSEATTSVQYPLNLNTCTAEELMTIDGIGETRANRIIAYREEIGQYTSVEQVMEVNGIGEGIYAQIGGYLTV